MAAPANADARWREIEDELLVAGTNLLKLRSSTSIDELLAHLVRVERVLARVDQDPPMSVKKALVPPMAALIKDKLLKHPHVNIQFVVASCLNQATRITAPLQPYRDHQMKDMFRLFMVVLRRLSQLDIEPDNNYDRAVKTLKFMAIGKTVLIIMDLDMDQMIVEMFQFFFDTIRPNHALTIFNYMEEVMTYVIEESDEVSLELLKPILDSVRIDNKNVSPVSWELGKAVFEKCSTKLQPYLREAVKKMNLDVNDYAEIIVSLCQDTSHENMVTEKITTAAALSGDGISKLDVASEAEQEGPTTQVNDGNGNENSSEMLKSSQQIVELESNDSKSDIGAVNNAEIVQSETDIVVVDRRRRVRKPNSLMRPEEGYEHIWRTGEKSSRKLSRVSDNKTKQKKKKDMLLPLEPEKTKMPSDSLHGEFDSADEANIVKRGQSKMVESPASNAAKAKSPENLTPEERERNRGSNVDFGEEMVNVRIKVWWPMDKMFYTGTVEAFDPSTKKHKIKYDDDEEEILDLREERWELFNERQSLQMQSFQKEEAGISSPDKELVKNEKKITKRQASSSRKQLAPSSSKRSKSEGGSPVHVKNKPDEDDDEIPQLFSFKHGKSRDGKKRSKTVKN